MSGVVLCDYKHTVVKRSKYKKRGHVVQSRVGSPEHQPGARPRRVARHGHPGESPHVSEDESDPPYRPESLVHGRTAGSPYRVTVGSNDGQAVGSDGSIVQSACFASSPTGTDRDGSHRVILQYTPQVEIVGLDQAAVEVPDPGDLHLSQSDVQTPSTWTASLGELGTRHAPSFGENRCPEHLLQSVAACPRECGWNVEQTVERGIATTDINRKQLNHLLRDSLVFAFANLSQSIGPMAVTQSSDPCMGTNSHTITDTIEMDTLQSNRNSDASSSRASRPPTANLHSLQQTESPFTATSQTRRTEKWPFIPPCYLLIFLGFLTVIGSLVPGLWRASSRNDLSGGFSLAQYILGVGIFVVGSMIAIHSKSCECWKTQSGVALVVDASH